MTKIEQHDKTKSSDLNPIENQWGAQPDNNFGYASEEERRAGRGLEDWELVDKMSESQPGIFPWFRTVVLSVIAGVVLFLTFAYALNYVVHYYGLKLLGH
jgi:hypothetical protein